VTTETTRAQLREVLPPGSPIQCTCPRHVMRPYALPRVVINGVTYQAVKADGRIVVDHRPGCAYAPREDAE